MFSLIDDSKIFKMRSGLTYSSDELALLMGTDSKRILIFFFYYRNGYLGGSPLWLH